MKRIYSFLLAGLLTACSPHQTIRKTPERNLEHRILTKQAENEKITIASFNIQVFGEKKRENPVVVQVLQDIVDDYDITAVQEVRDKTMTTIPFFLSKLRESKKDFEVIASPRLGRTNSKEQYAFFYDKSKIQYLGESYVYPDTADYFEREPHLAYFKAGNFDFWLINIHIKPDDAVNEISHLADVLADLDTRSPKERDYIILGDLNADGKYFNEDDSSHMMKDQLYYWVISNNADTTVANSDNTYDRIIFMKKHTLTDFTGEWGVRKFDQEFNLTFNQAKKVSDHYPIWAMFYSNRDND